jgi:hypothetical protein
VAGVDPRNFHVLFVHGVGTHSRLSSLLQPYQALRADTRSPEVAIDYEDLNPEWRLQVFDDSADTPYLKLYVPGAPPGAAKAVYLYEVNYSALAGVVRANHPLDLTGLFVGFDLAVNAARSRLAKNPAAAPTPGGSGVDHAALAVSVQRLAGVLVAATVPILGIPSLLFRRYSEGLVATFTRFFEDIATFALDRSGEQLISAHFDRTLRSILQSGRFEKADGEYAQDMLVIAAHSLGAVVTHSHIVRALAEGKALPSRVLTFGSPIALVCWLWLLLDFTGMDFARPHQDDAHFFSWSTLVRDPSSAPAPMLWINVVNHLDPIATAFPLDYVDLAHPPAENASLLAGGRVHHRFIRTGSSPASAHTAYFDDRAGFLEILSRLAGLRAGAPEAVLDAASGARQPARHWHEGIAGLRRLRWQWWLAGMAAIGAYIGAIAWASGNSWLMWLVLAFAWPPVTIETLAFWQRFLCGKPTKRNSAAAIEALPWGDPWSFPHRLRHFFRGKLSGEEEAALVLGPRPGPLRKSWMWFVSFMPSLLAMLLPLAVLGWAQGYQSTGQVVAGHWKWILPAILVFTTYLIAFAISEFLAQWRAALVKATRTS